MKMALQQRSAAYDISRFEERKPTTESEKRDNILKLPKKKAKVNVGKKNKLKPATVLLAGVTFLLSVAVVWTMLLNQVTLAELTAQINNNAAQLEECKSENTQWQMKLEEKFSPENVTQHALALGMVPNNSGRVECLGLYPEDKAELPQKRECGFTRIF